MPDQPSPDWPAGYGRRVLAEVDSTLDEARRIAPELSGPEWVLALRQTKARGRRGRPWHNPDGNFAATLMFRPNQPAATAALRSFVAALALYDAVAALAPGADLSLKWPNDVLLFGGKLAGILLESVGAGTDAHYLAIGIGVNLRAAPDSTDVEPEALRPVSLLGQTGITATPEQFLDHLAVAYARHEQAFTTFGFAPIRALWLERAARRGETIRARLATQEHVGTFQDVDNEGQLVLETAKGRMTIPAADIFF